MFWSFLNKITSFILPRYFEHKKMCKFWRYSYFRKFSHFVVWGYTTSRDGSALLTNPIIVYPTKNIFNINDFFNHCRFRNIIFIKEVHAYSLQFSLQPIIILRGDKKLAEINLKLERNTSLINLSDESKISQEYNERRFEQRRFKNISKIDFEKTHILPFICMIFKKIDPDNCLLDVDFLPDY